MQVKALDDENIKLQSIVFRNDHSPAENVLKANFAEFGDLGKGKNLS